MKAILFKMFIFGLTTVVLIVGCSKIAIYSDISYTPIPKVSLKEYKSVQLRDTMYQNPNLALGVAISGGGSRAQYYGLGVLIGLEEIKSSVNSERNFLKEIDYFSTISGGCYAAGYYLTIAKNILLKNNQSFGEFYFSKGEKFKDFVGKSANPLKILNNNKNEKGGRYSMTNRLDYEVLQYDSKNPNDSIKFNSQMSLKDFFIKADWASEPTLPIFVATGTLYNNGERIPFMPHIIANLNIDSSLAPNKGQIAKGIDGINNGYDFPLTYAITASSAFPGVLPKTKFGIKGSKKEICIIDGGAVDNFGYTTLLELLNNDTIIKKVNKKALIIDCSGEGQIERFSENKKIGLLPLLKTTSLYTVQTKYMYYEEDLKNQMCTYGIPEKNSLVIGFSTIRKHIQELTKDVKYNTLKAEFANTKDKKEETGFDFM